MVEHIRARAPMRIGFAGDGTDVDPYAFDRGGIMVSAAINKYAYCTLTPMEDSKDMSVRSHYYGRYNAPLDGGPLKLNGNNDLIKAVANYFDIKKGFEAVLYSDVPAGSGVGCSSVTLLSMITAVANWLETDMTKDEIAKLTYHLEREVIGFAGGWQDQFESVYGGFNILRFGDHNVKVEPLDIEKDVLNELQCRSILCYLGRPKKSADIIMAQIEDYKAGRNVADLDRSKIIAEDMAKALVNADYDKLGDLLEDAWECKKNLSGNVTNREVDKMYKIAREAGAIGGKLTGSGGGGFIYLLCEYDLKVNVVEALKAKGAMVTDFMFDPKGVTTWRNNSV
jgi:D-glycero-alpha-D-manno-heptose-7-phosphate kinase